MKQETLVVMLEARHFSDGRFTKSLIESKKVDNSQIEYQKALLEHNMEYYKMVQDEEAFKRYTSLQQKEY